MRNISFALACVGAFSLVSCVSASGSGIAQEYNYAEIAKYADFLNGIFAADDNLTGFWWDCSDIVLRSSLDSHHEIIDAIMRNYGGSYSKSGSGYTEESAAAAVRHMKTGWNLGNTLDSNSYKALWDSSSGKWYDNWASPTADELGWIVRWGDGTTSAWEAAWGQPVTTKEMIAYVKSLGFGAVRLPVTWAEHIDSDGTIDSEWMGRVKECVDYIIGNGMYCVLNVHHDGGSDGWIKACASSWEQYQDRFEKIWTQIARTFANYDERLIFESMNEVLDAEANWNPNVVQARAANVYINRWNNLFVKTVRATGGNNATRNLVIMTYAGNGSSLIFDSGFSLPEDSAEGHLIVEVHNYSPVEFTSVDASWTKMTARWDEKKHGRQLRAEMEILSKKAAELGVPIIVGEYAAFPKKYAEYDT